MLLHLNRRLKGEVGHCQAKGLKIELIAQDQREPLTIWEK